MQNLESFDTEKVALSPLERLKHHVSGAIARGEKTAVEAVDRGGAKHTPAPWTKEFGKHTPGHASTMRLVSPDNTHAVCDVFWYCNGNANANLIAMAPEMAEFVRLVYAATDGGADGNIGLGTRQMLAAMAEDLLTKVGGK